MGGSKYKGELNNMRTSHKVGLALGVGAAMGGGVYAAGELSASPERTTLVEQTAASFDGTEVPVEDQLQYIYNNPSSRFSCEDAGLVTLHDLPVDINKRDAHHRLWTDSVGTPLTSELSDSEAVALEYFGRLCKEPPVLASALIREANTPFDDDTVIGDYIEWLSPYVGHGVESINDFAERFTESPTASFEDNRITTALRVQAANNLASVLQNKQNLGVHMDVEVTNRYALKMPYAQDTASGVPEFTAIDEPYIGNVLVFRETLKGRDENGAAQCIITFSGVNVDDQSQVIFNLPVNPADCAPDPTSTPIPVPSLTPTPAPTETPGSTPTPVPTRPPESTPTPVPTSPPTPEPTHPPFPHQTGPTVSQITIPEGGGPAPTASAVVEQLDDSQGSVPDRIVVPTEVPVGGIEIEDSAGTNGAVGPIVGPEDNGVTASPPSTAPEVSTHNPGLADENPVEGLTDQEDTNVGTGHPEAIDPSTGVGDDTSDDNEAGEETFGEFGDF